MSGMSYGYLLTVYTDFCQEINCAEDAELYSRSYVVGVYPTRAAAMAVMEKALEPFADVYYKIEKVCSLSADKAIRKFDKAHFVREEDELALEWRRRNS